MTFKRIYAKRTYVHRNRVRHGTFWYGYVRLTSRVIENPLSMSRHLIIDNKSSAHRILITDLRLDEARPSANWPVASGVMVSPECILKVRLPRSPGDNWRGVELSRNFHVMDVSTSNMTVQTCCERRKPQGMNWKLWFIWPKDSTIA